MTPTPERAAAAPWPTPPTPLAAPRAGVVVHGRGVGAVPTLPALLDDFSLLPPGAADRASAVLGWGLKPSAARAAAFAQAHHLPLWRLEDGFLRSIAPGAGSPPWSVVLDDVGIYYAADAPSRLEQLIAQPPGPEARARAGRLTQAWREARVSKYNHAREAWPEGAADTAPVLVVDQTHGDASITHGSADAARFTQMLQAALDEHPTRPIWLKVHPDVVAGTKRGHFDVGASGRLTTGEASRVRVIATDAHPPALLAQAAAVYTVTSQMGFEALLWQRPVRCFGMPFYAGWGLTDDLLPPPARRAGGATLDDLVHAALVAYPRYLHPETGRRCEVEDLLAWMALQRRQRERFPAEVHAIGFSRWKKPIVRAFLAGSTVQFAPRRVKALPPGATVVLWGRASPPPAAKAAQVLRIEDGFLRSVGLGADLVRPLSWVIDRRGMYYDATATSDLEHHLQHGEFDATRLDRARRLRDALVATGITKYNVGGAGWRRPPAAAEVVLVVGQVETDAAVALGAPGLRTNLALLRAARERHPQAHLVYKPHPDVVARLRRAGQGEDDAARWCDEVVVDAPMATMLRAVDVVHVISSLAGFEALLRGRRVVVHGAPFYAGWGLTEDTHPLPRRTRRLTLDALVAGVLIDYPTYVSRTSGHFTTPERALDELQQWRETEGPTRASPLRQAWRALIRRARVLSGGPA